MVWNTCQKYLHYLSSRENDEGTVTFGIGDWCFMKHKLKQTLLLPVTIIWKMNIWQNLQT